MPNEFQSMQSGSGLLKDSYDDGDNSPVSDALKKKRKKSFEKISDEVKSKNTLEEEITNGD